MNLRTRPDAAAALTMGAMLLLGGCGYPLKIPFHGVPENSVLRVHSTVQYPDTRRPWIRKQPVTREGLGTVIAGGLVLVTADMAAHTTCIDLESPAKKIHATATVEALDEACNLALLRPVGGEILGDLRAMDLEGPLGAGTPLDILQLEANGTPALSRATITTAAVGPYPSGDSFLAYRTTATIPQRDGSFEIPALHNGRLAGLVMRYDPRTQAADIIPSPLIDRFLREASKPGFNGLAKAGIIWASLRSGTLREWLGLSGRQGGVMIAPERKGPAEQAGLRKGDVILSLAGKPIDAEGNYEDPVFGKTSFGNIVSIGSTTGEKIETVYFRPDPKGHGSLGTATLTLAASPPESEISPSRLAGNDVPHTFYGGLLLQELSRPFLREWGSNWPSDAPQNLVALDVFQNEETGNRRHYVILSGILPSEETLGCDRWINRVVERINGRPVSSIEDVSEARNHPSGGFHRIDLERGAGPVFLDASTLDAEEARLLSRYGIRRSGNTSRTMNTPPDHPILNLDGTRYPISLSQRPSFRP